MVKKSGRLFGYLCGWNLPAQPPRQSPRLWRKWEGPSSGWTFRQRLSYPASRTAPWSEWLSSRSRRASDRSPGPGEHREKEFYIHIFYIQKEDVKYKKAILFVRKKMNWKMNKASFEWLSTVIHEAQDSWYLAEIMKNKSLNQVYTIEVTVSHSVCSFIIVIKAGYESRRCIQVTFSRQQCRLGNCTLTLFLEDMRRPRHGWRCMLIPPVELREIHCIDKVAN